MSSALSGSPGSSSYALAIASVAAIGGFLFGFDSGVINGTVDGLQAAFGSGGIATGFNVASMLLGCAMGAFFAGGLADRFGRRGLLRVAAVFFWVSAWGSGWSDSGSVFVGFRVLGGLAVGAASVLAPAYIAEIAPAAYRGALSSVQQVAIISGLFIAFLSNYALAGMAGASTESFWWGYEAWRWMFWVEMLPAALFFVALFLIPESPRFLVLRGAHAEAERVLSRLAGEVAAARTVREIASTLALGGQPADRVQRFSDLLGEGSHIRPIVWVGIGLAVLQQFVGINVVFYYGAVLWQSVGFSESDALLTNVINGGVSLVACGVAMMTIDRVGRRQLLLVGSLGMAIALAVMAGIFGSASVDSASGIELVGVSGTTALVAANVYVFFFNLSWGPVMWVMLGEMFPNRMRGSALAVCGLAQWLANFLITASFPLLLEGVGLGVAYGFYATCAVLSIAFVRQWVIETRGVELEAMAG